MTRAKRWFRLGLPIGSSAKYPCDSIVMQL